MIETSEQMEIYRVGDIHDEVCVVCREQLGKMHEVIHSKRLGKQLGKVVITYMQLNPCVSNNEIEIAIQIVRQDVIG